MEKPAMKPSDKIFWETPEIKKSQLLGKPLKVVKYRTFRNKWSFVTIAYQVLNLKEKKVIRFYISDRYPILPIGTYFRIIAAPGKRGLIFGIEKLKKEGDKLVIEKDGVVMK